MRNIGWIQWIIRVIKRDMEQYEEDVGVKQEVYRTVKRKSYIFGVVALLISSAMSQMYRYNTVLAKWLALTNPDVELTTKIVIILSVAGVLFALASGVRIWGHVTNIIYFGCRCRMLVGREKELHLLHDIQNDDSSHFVAVYGRMREGKTFLIREAFGYRFTFQHAGLSEGGMKEQIYAFTSSLKDAGYDMKKQPKNWLEAFEALKDVIRLSSEKKKIIFIDELSWMDTQKSDLMVALENFWNGFASARKDIVLIVCASATSWMLSKVVHNKGGLYNRLTEQIHLRTFCLRECEAYVKAAGLALNRNQILQYYMIFGGVPYYWGFLKKGLSLSQNIDSILFEKDAPSAR